MTNSEALVRGIVGAGAPVIGFITSLQEQIEWHLRVGSLVLGILASLIAIASMIRKWNKDGK